MDDFDEYKQMKEAGVNAQTVYRYAEKQGLDSFARIRMLREVFGLSLTEAKEVAVCTQSDVLSLTEYQEKLFPALKKVIQEDDP